MSSLGYSLIDCDNHYYEPDDAFTRHIEDRFKRETVWVDRSRDDNLGTLMLGNERLSFMSIAPGDYVGRPGAMRDFFKGKTDSGGMVNLNPICASDCPEFISKTPRLSLMDEQEVEASVLIPTLGVGVEYQLRQHPQVMYPSLRAFNRWLNEDWGWGDDGRIFATAMISLIDVDEAIIELERLLKEGVRLLLVNVGPVNGRSPADTHFDRFWARVEEADVPTVLHIGESGFNELYAAPWGEPPLPPSHRFTAFNSFVGMGPRTIVDTAASLIFLNLFGRFPKLRFMIVEFGSEWVPYFLSTMDKNYRMADHKTRWRYGKPEKPSEVFRKHFWVVPFYEDNVAQLADLIGVDHVINGSDFPHPEGLEWPMQMCEELSAFDERSLRLIMRDNACGLLGLSVN